MLGSRYHVKFKSLLHMAYANLKSKKFRSTVTVVGIAIGAGSVFLLISFGLGLQNLVERQISDGLSISTIDVSVSGSRLLKISDESIKNISAIDHVESASGFYAKASKMTISGSTADVVLYGIDNLYIKTSDFVMKAGRIINPANPNEIVISSSVLEALGVTDLSGIVGSSVNVQIRLEADQVVDQKFDIVGVMAPGTGSEAFVSSSAPRSLGIENFTGAKVLVDHRDQATQVRKVIEGMGYVTSSPIDTLNQVDQFFKILRLILVSFGAIGMVIAILGMINTLTVSLLERTKEVALMLALGARPRDMKLLFIIESQLLSLTGAVSGMLGAGLIGLAIDFVLNQLAQSRGATGGFSVFSAPWWLILVSLLSMALVGLVVAYIPATRASRINSIDALRRE